MEGFEQLDYLPFDSAIKHAKGTVTDTSGTLDGGAKFKTSRGVPQVLLKPCVDFGGCDKAKAQKPVEEVRTLGKHGIRIIDVAQISSDGATGKDPNPKATAQTIRLSV